MKNKKTAWILLPAVLSIWGFLGWKLYAAMNTESLPTRNFSNAQTGYSEDQLIPDTYRLLLDYPDPFLAAVKSESAHTVKKSSQSSGITIPKIAPVTTTTWPEIQFAGLVKSPKDGKMVGFLSVNGVSHFVKNQDVIEELLILKLWNDSVKVSLGRETRMVRK
jgi:hypothetical protein